MLIFNDGGGDDGGDVLRGHPPPHGSALRGTPHPCPPAPASHG